VSEVVRMKGVLGLVWWKGNWRGSTGDKFPYYSILNSKRFSP
jgi:hypothetical protein